MDVYWLSKTELDQFEQQLINRTLISNKVSIGAQEYVVFNPPNKYGAAIAWPTLDGKLTGRIGETHFVEDVLIAEIIKTVSKVNYSKILFPLRGNLKRE